MIEMSNAFIQLQIENISVCNAACGFCPYPAVSKVRPLGTMPMELYHKIIDDSADIPLIGEYCITGLGEPLLDRFVVERVRYGREKKPTAIIDIFTNGVYMTPAKFDALKDAGISSMQISLNAVDAEQHEHIMGLKGKFDLVCENIDYAIAHRDGVRIEVRAVLSHDDFTRGDGCEFLARWGEREKGGYGALILEGNWSDDNRTMRKFDPSDCCFRALSQIYVMWDGRISSCCFDPTGKQIFGDLKKQTIREAYNSGPWLAFRQAHDLNQADKYAVCASCTRI